MTWQERDVALCGISGGGIIVFQLDNIYYASSKRRVETVYGSNTNDGADFTHALLFAVIHAGTYDPV